MSDSLVLPDWAPFDDDDNMFTPAGSSLPEAAFEVVMEAHTAASAEHGDEGAGYNLVYMTEVLALNGWTFTGVTA